MIKSNNTNQYTFSDIDSSLGLKNAAQKGVQAIIDEITASGLRGCGGAGFPTGMKLKFTVAAEGSPKYVVCNADEGEPGTFKDRELFTNYPKFVFDGMAIAAIAIGATEGYIYLRGEYQYMVAHLEQALDAWHKDNKNFTIQIRMGAGAYVCGEETALLESLEGYRGEPRNRPPFPVAAGYLGKPTFLSNVETFARMACIMAKGANWFNAVGTEKSKGYKLFSISGDCANPGVYELPMGTTVSEMLKVVGATDTKAVQMGGASGRCLAANEFERRIAFEDAPPGGSIVIFNSKRNMLDVAENFMEFFCEESCGQCTPCRVGNEQLLAGIKAAKKEGKISNWDDLLELSDMIQTTSKCGLGQASPNAFLDIINKFCSELK